MTPDEISQWTALLGTLGGNGFLALTIIALLKGWVITSAHHDEVCRQYEKMLERERAKVAQLRNGGT